MTFVAAENRYATMPYRRTGRSGLKLPTLSLGLWQNFGHARPIDAQRAILRLAFDCGITHFDLANNYGPPPGAAETNFGRIFASDFRPYRDELIISSKAGYDMWPGPYGEWGSRKYLLSSLDASLGRKGALTDTYLDRARALNNIAAARNQSLAQLAITWILRQPAVTSVLVGASSVGQLEQNIAALDAPALTRDEVTAIEPYAVHGTAMG